MKKIILILLCLIPLCLLSFSLLKGGKKEYKEELSEETPAPSASPEIIEDIEVVFVPDGEAVLTLGGEVIKTVKVKPGTEIELFTPDVGECRFVCWKYENGEKVTADVICPQESMRIYAYCLPYFGTHEPYLFMNDLKLMLPEEHLTYSQFGEAVAALTPAGTDNIGINKSDEAITVEQITYVLSNYYTHDEINEVFDPGEYITRAQFAHNMNLLLGRTGERVEISENTLKTVDIKEDTAYRDDVLEASIPHNVSDSGTEWGNMEIENDWRDFGNYLEMGYTEATETGTVEEDFGSNGETFLTYLPFGYDPAEKYNVIIYLNGSYGDPYKMLGLGYEYEHFNTSFHTLLTTREYIDFLIQYGYCDPLIVVSTNTTIDKAGVWRYVELLQHTVENYSTYAESSDIDELIDKRSHFAIAGPSNAAQSVCVAIQELPDIFGSFGLFSGIYNFTETCEALKQKRDIDYMVLNSGGWDDKCYEDVLAAYETFSQMDNMRHISYVCVAQYGHNWETFDAGILELLSKFNPNTRNIHIEF